MYYEAKIKGLHVTMRTDYLVFKTLLGSVRRQHFPAKSFNIKILPHTFNIAKC